MKKVINKVTNNKKQQKWIYSTYISIYKSESEKM